MAKRGVKKSKEEMIAAEEATRLEQEERRLQAEMKNSLIEAGRAGTPSWRYSVGETVSYGHTEVQIQEIYQDGLCYRVLAKDKSGTLTRVILPWFRLRKYKRGNSALISNSDIRLNYMNIDISILLMKHLLEVVGIDMNPPYQRGYVWSDSERTALLDSIFCGADIGKFTVRVLDMDEYQEKHLGYEIIDGKQRFLTILDFYLNRFQYKGFYFNELSSADRRAFLDHNVSWCELKNLTQKDTLRVFLLVNRGGRTVSDDVIHRAEKLLSDLTEKDSSNP